jgi:2-amino-4-hydroxy-6-hydroxymethyldihydropteridine diphosphokinase
LARALIALGANVAGPFGPPAAGVARAFGVIGGIVARSRLYRSAAWPDPADPEYVNAVAQIETADAPAALLARLHRIEAAFGRRRGAANAPRPLDLDILDYAGRISAPGDTPILPHPRMSDRAFVLIPLSEIAPDWTHPVTGAGIDALIAALPDPGAATPL